MTTDPTPESYDYIIVGAGSAGATLAGRLSASGTHTVLLLEAGPSDKNQAVSIPAAFSQLFKSERDWNYETTPQPGLGGRTVYWPRGKTLGGSSSMNAMMWVRGFASDYDRWAELAGNDWSWESLLPLFRRIERTMDSNDPDHGMAGPLSIEPQRHPRPHTDAFLRSVHASGHRIEQANTRQPDGFSQTMVSQKKGARASTSTAYLAPAARRSNLTVRTGALARKVLFEGRRAVAVDYLRDGIPATVTARREIVLCGGAVNTPQLLKLSGIGDPEELKKFGIDVVAPSREVGLNLRDHLIAGLVPEAMGGTLYTATKAKEVLNYLLRRRGMLTSNVAEAYGFIRSDPSLAEPDLELLFAPAAYVGEGLVPTPGHGITLGTILLKPQSHGTITLASAEPTDKPIIDPRYLSHPDDQAALLSGLATCEKILSTGPLRELLTGRYLAPAGGEAMAPGERDLQTILRHAHTLYHPTSTARMGQDEGSVVDPELRVRGVEGLRIADASVMPEIIRGHTNAPSIVIGEKAADLLATDTSRRAGGTAAAGAHR
jgi:choline dehydrogenase